ncbi:Hca operon transcriptional activator [Escherichia coli]|nr:Hca operon transcriptional activator [Escherichia coli]
MELRHLRYFVAVAQALNFTRAAEKLHTSQPSLSSQIRDLENCVGVPLLVRDKRKVALTAAGECFLQDALAILEQAEKCQITGAENCSGRQTINHWLCAIGGSEFTAKSITDVSSQTARHLD